MGRRRATRAPPSLLAILLSAPAACALRSIQLKQLDTGKDVFPGGAKEAGCSACIAVMEDIALEMGQPVDSVDEGVTNLAEYRAAKAGKRSAVERARRDEVNTELFVQQVLNPKRCHPAMQKYDLGFIQNRHLFVRKPENGDGHYPIHMELNEVAKYELDVESPRVSLFRRAESAAEMPTAEAPVDSVGEVKPTAMAAAMDHAHEEW